MRNTFQCNFSIPSVTANIPEMKEIRKSKILIPKERSTIVQIIKNGITVVKPVIAINPRIKKKK